MLPLFCIIMNYRLALFLILLGLQFFYSTSVSDSFVSPKWFFVSAFLALFFLCFYFYRQTSEPKVLYQAVNPLTAGFSKWFSIVLLYFLFLPFAFDLWHKNYAGIFFSLGIPALFICFILFFHSLYNSMRPTRQISVEQQSQRIFLDGHSGFSGFGFFNFTLLAVLVLGEYFGFNPFFQGGKYHLSVFSGNPNIIAALLLFWYWPALAYVQKKAQKNLRLPFGSVWQIEKLFSGFSLLILSLTYSRAAILVFVFLYIVYFGGFAFSRMKALLLALVLVLPLFLFLLVNPYGFSKFSHYAIRLRELNQTMQIITNSPFLGIGRHNYRMAYWQSLEKTSFLPFSLGNPSVDERIYVRLSDESHFSLFWPFLSFGIPWGGLWLIAFLAVLIFAYRGLEKYEFYSLLSLLLAAQVYFLFSFSLLLIPFMIFLAKGIALRLPHYWQFRQGLFVPCLLMVLGWAFFCAREFRHSFIRDNATSEEDFIYLSNSFSYDGEDDYRYVSFLINNVKEINIDQVFPLLEKAYLHKPDPAYFYYRALAFFYHGDHTSARAEVERGLCILPTSGNLYYARALLTDDLSEQIYNYQLALSVSYSHFRAWNNLGICYFEMAEKIKEGVYYDSLQLCQWYQNAILAFEKALLYAPAADQDYLSGLQVRYRTVRALLMNLEACP